MRRQASHSGSKPVISSQLSASSNRMLRLVEIELSRLRLAVQRQWR